jgi:hypothetical protein
MEVNGKIFFNFGIRRHSLRLEQGGITINARPVLEGFENFRGGLNTTRVVGASTFDLSLSLETEKLLHWQGAEFYVDCGGTIRPSLQAVATRSWGPGDILERSPASMVRSSEARGAFTRCSIRPCGNLPVSLKRVAGCGWFLSFYAQE